MCSDGTLAAWDQPGWEYLYHRNWQTLQIRAQWIVLDQESATMAHGPTIAHHLFYNVLFEHNYAHSFMSCLAVKGLAAFSLQQQSSSNRACTTYKAYNIYYLFLYRKILLTPDLNLGKWRRIVLIISQYVRILNHSLYWTSETNMTPCQLHLNLFKKRWRKC